MTDQLTFDGLAVSESSKTPVSKAAKAVDAVVYCDGACSGNPGPGGWGCIVECDGERREFSGGQARTTNNQMELTALIEGLKQVPAGTKVRVVTDSEYVVKGVNLWLKGWIRNGWQTAARKPVK